MSEILGTATAAIGLAATVFQTAKGIRDTIRLAMSEDEEITYLLEENKAEIGFLIETYNNYKELLDQHQLTEDLEQLLTRAVKLQQFLIEFKDKTPDRKRPSLKAVWKAGDLRPKLEALNRGIVRISTRWKERIDIRTLALLSKTRTETTEWLEHQDRMQTNATLTVVETIRAEATEVIKVIQHSTVQTCACSLSMHSQIEPDGFTSSTTRVAVDTNSSLVTFYILSPDASLSYDQIKMRLEEYSQALKSNSPTIEFFTKHGKTIVCRKQADKMEEQLQQAKDLLQAMVEAKNVPTIGVIHRLCDLAKLLDQFNLQEECLVVGDCAIKLAQTLGSRALEFQKVQAQTISRIAGLGAYERRARPLFIQAISVCEAFANEDGSESAKFTLLEVLRYAGFRGHAYPDLCIQWFGRAVDLIAELPSAMVTDELRATIYISYGTALHYLKEHSRALATTEKAVAFYRSLASEHGHALYNKDLALALHNYGVILSKVGRHEAALSVSQEAVSLYRTLDVDGQKQKNRLADVLHNYGKLLSKMGRHEDALSVSQEAISLYRTLNLDGQEQKQRLADALHCHGNTLSKMGRHEHALSVRQKVVSLYRTLNVDGQEQKQCLADVLHKYGNSLSKMGRHEDALSVSQEAISLYRASNPDGKEQKQHLADALHNYGITLSDMGRHGDALSVRLEVISLYRTLNVDGQEQKQHLAAALNCYSFTLFNMGRHEDALSASQEAVSLYRTFDVNGQEQKQHLADILRGYGATLSKMGRHEDALSIRQEAVSLYRTLNIDGQEQKQ